MSKDYQKEVVEFLKPTYDKMKLSEARSVYGKEISVGAKAVKALEAFNKSLVDLGRKMDKERADNPSDSPAGQGAGARYNELRNIIDGQLTGGNYSIKYVMKGMDKVMDILGDLDDYKS